MAAFKVFLWFSGLGKEEILAYKKRCEDALDGTVELQAEYQRNEDQAIRALELIAAALASGRKHVTDTDGNRPDNWEVLGWREETKNELGHENTNYRRLGDCIGTVDSDAFYLIPEAAFNAARELAGNEPLGISEKTLAKRLHEKGLLISGYGGQDGRHILIKKTIMGVRQRVLPIARSALLDIGDKNQFKDGKDFKL